MVHCDGQSRVVQVSWRKLATTGRSRTYECFYNQVVNPSTHQAVCTFVVDGPEHVNPQLPLLITCLFILCILFPLSLNPESISFLRKESFTKEGCNMRKLTGSGRIRTHRSSDCDTKMLTTDYCRNFSPNAMVVFALSASTRNRQSYATARLWVCDTSVRKQSILKFAMKIQSFKIAACWEAPGIRWHVWFSKRMDLDGCHGRDRWNRIGLLNCLLLHLPCQITCFLVGWLSCLHMAELYPMINFWDCILCWKFTWLWIPLQESRKPDGNFGEFF